MGDLPEEVELEKLDATPVGVHTLVARPPVPVVKVVELQLLEFTAVVAVLVPGRVVDTPLEDPAQYNKIKLHVTTSIVLTYEEW